MSEKRGIPAALGIKPDHAEEFATMVTGAVELAKAKPGTVIWYATKQREAMSEIFDAFADNDARQAHFGGEIAKPMGTLVADFLPGPPAVSFVEILSANRTDWAQP